MGLDSYGLPHRRMLQAEQGRHDAAYWPRPLALPGDTDPRGIAELRSRGFLGIHNRHFRKRSPLKQALIRLARSIR
jgi:hypothetical protein